ncbi:MAG: hypothetical protein CMK36_02840 [Porticoccaceae bacterium]|nr:hypothetical protein [Porticoccaceae bacterium]
MRMILINSRADKTRSINLSVLGQISLAAVVLGIPLISGLWLGSSLADKSWRLVFENTIAEMRQQILVQHEDVESGKHQVENTLSAMTAKLAQMRSRIVRLDALGEQLTQIASLQSGEFDFSISAGLGGPNDSLNSELTRSMSSQEQIKMMFASLENNISDREAQLNVLQSMMSDDRLRDESIVAGRPILKGWLSSQYGMRTDPFHGKQQWHSGIDFAGREGSDIIAVAAGVVTWSGAQSGYGNMVEINHSDGYVTRYAHNKENVAKLGAIVKRGDVIAKMGSTGRSTGPHVHFEVYKNGRTVDPSTYIRRSLH